MRADATGGYYYGLLQGEGAVGGGSFYLASGLELALRVMDTMRIGVGLGYRNYWDVYQGLQVRLSTISYPSVGRQRPMSVERGLPLRPEPLEPGDVQPKPRLRGIQLRAINLQIVFVEVQFLGLFTDDVLEITETTKVTANIVFEYTRRGRRQRQQFVETLCLYDRNAMSWDDDRRAAAFVTV